MVVRIWTREGNERLFRTTRNNPKRINFRPYEHVEGLVTADLRDLDELHARRGKREQNPELVLGKVRAWDAVRDNRCLNVFVEEYDLSSNGLCLTQYNKEDVHFHRGKSTIDEKTGVDRFELRAGNSFVNSVFTAFDFFNEGRVKTGYTPRLVLYDATGELDELGNMANPTSVDGLPAAIAKKEEGKRKRKDPTETSTWRGRG